MARGVLDNEFGAVIEAASEADYRAELERFARSLGFDLFASMLVLDRAPGLTDFVTVANTPSEYLPTFEMIELSKRDPVMQHCRTRRTPIAWDREIYERHGVPELWEEQAQFGYRSGIAVCFHFAPGRHFMIGLDRDQALPSDPHELTRLVADLQLFGIHAQEATERLECGRRLVTTPQLSPREVEALAWTAAGKTAWEIGQIMGISERTVGMHLQSAIRKTDASNKHHAALKAYQAGLIY